jgi:hypothetical protein
MMGEANQCWRIGFDGPDPCVRGKWILQGPGRPDLPAVEMIAHLALLTRRMGVTVRVVDVSGELVDVVRPGRNTDRGGGAARRQGRAAQRPRAARKKLSWATQCLRTRTGLTSGAGDAAV